MASQAKLSRVAINRILLATDFSAESENATRCAVSLARRYDSALYLTHALPVERPMASFQAWPPPAEITHRYALQEAWRRLEKTAGLNDLVHEDIIRSGHPSEVILQSLQEKNIDLVVLGTHGDSGVKRLFLGSTAEKVIRHAPCPVLTLGPHLQRRARDRFDHILFATDFSSGSMRALAYALMLAEEDRAELTMLHVIESKPGSQSELLEWKRGDHGRLTRLIPTDCDLAFKPEIEIEVGTPEVQIVHLADTREASLIVMGSHFAGAVSTHVPWTTLHHVLRNAHCPVLTVHGDLCSA